MDTSIVVVVQDGANNRHERLVLNPERPLRVGRAFSNDLILQDQQIDAIHGELQINESGSFQWVDLGSLNGFSVDGSGDATFESGACVELGRTRLSIYKSDHEVGPAIAPSRWEAIRSLLEQPQWAFTSLGLLLVVALLSRLGETIEPLSAETVISVVGRQVLGLGLWGLFWGLVTKLWRDAMHLRAHVSIGACAGIASYLFTQAAQFVGWQTQSIDVIEFMSTAGEALLLFATLGLTLGVATRLRPPRIMWLACIPGLLLMLSVYLLPLLSDEEPPWYPDLVADSYPPSWQLTGGESLEDFLGAADGLYDKSADRAATRFAELEELRTVTE